MIPRPILTILVLALPLLVVLFGVVMAAAGLTASIDPAAAPVFRWIGVACGMLVIVNLVLLVAALGVRALEGSEAPSDSERTEQD